MIKIFKYLNPKEWLMAGISLIFIISQVWLDLKMPEYMQEITLLVQTSGSVMKDIWIAGGFMLLCALGSLASAIIVGFLRRGLPRPFHSGCAVCCSKRLILFQWKKSTDSQHQV